MKIDLAKSEERIIEGLKDFQRATVDRVIELTRAVKTECWLQMKSVSGKL